MDGQNEGRRYPKTRVIEGRSRRLSPVRQRSSGITASQRLQRRALERVTMSEYIQLPMKDGSSYTVPTLLIDHFQHELPEIDVEREFRCMALWLETHPTRRKTKRGIKAFIGTWLMKAVKDAPVLPKKVPEVVKDTRSSCFACFEYY